jgi:exopolyphosphatase / guanosine-5'-triphosphate,3'-diphosphate pyrophosphatase
MKSAAMDIGSNTVRVLLAEGLGQSLKRIQVRRKITRLSGGFDGRLNADSIERTVSAARELAGIARDSGVREIRTACTGVVRKALNKKIFMDRLRVEAGVEPCLLSGNMEAKLAAVGACSRLGDQMAEILLVDIGGFSTELSIVGKPLEFSQSFDIGVVSLTEKILKNDPPSKKQIDSLRRLVAAGLRGFFYEKLPDRLVGIAGTPTTLAAIDLKLPLYDPSKVHRHEIDADRIDEIFHTLATISAQMRLEAFPGLEKGREDLLPAGIIIIQEIMKLGGYRKLVVSEGGLLDGLLLAETWPPLGYDFLLDGL